MKYPYRITVLVFALLLCGLAGYSQILRTKNWHFGYNSALIFETDTILYDTSAIHSDESSCSISDINGKLLLYSDGITIWNRHHRPITNGTGMLGHQSSSQGSVLVAADDRDSIFYMFATDYRGNNNGLTYNVISHISGDSFVVSSKNNRLYNAVTEPVAVVNHANNSYKWVMARQFNGYSYFAYLLTPDGVVDCPVISQSPLYIGVSTNPASAQNSSAFSPNAEYFAYAYYWMNRGEIFKFNPYNGVLTKPISLSGIRLPTGISFSANSGLLYFSERDYDIIQTQLTPFDSASVLQNVVHLKNVYNYKHSLIMSPLKQLMLIQQGKYYFGKITFPNLVGDDCNYIENGLPLGKVVWRAGLPNFNFSYYHTPAADFSYTHHCHNNTFEFAATDTTAATTHNWVATHGSTRITQSGRQVSFTLADTGNWTIQLIATAPLTIDTVTKTITVYPLIPANFLGSDSAICPGDTINLVLKTPANMHCIHWMGQTGTDYHNYHTDSLRVTGPGSYYVKITDRAFCTYYDTLTVAATTMPPKPVISYNTGQLAGTFIAAAYNWFINDTPLLQTTQRSILPPRNGWYRLQYVNQSGCRGPLSDSFWVGNAAIPAPGQGCISLYPNPTGSSLNLTVAQSGNYHITIYRPDGKTMLNTLQYINRQTTIDTQLPPGQYLLVLAWSSQKQTIPFIIKP